MVRSRYAFGDDPRVHQQVLRGTPPRCAPESAREDPWLSFPAAPVAAPTFDHQWPGPLRSTPVIRLGGGPIQLYG